MTGRPAARVAWSLVGVFVVLVTLSFVEGIANGPGEATWGTRWGGAAASVTFIAFPVVGAVLVARRVAGILGWLSIAVGLSLAVSGVTGEHARYALVTKPGSVPGGHVAAWLTDWLWVPAIGLAIFLILLFPDGRLPSPRWRWLVAALVAVMAIGVIGIAFAPGPLDESPFATNPLGIERIGGFFDALQAASLGLFACAPLAAVALLSRYRRSHGEEREQLKWFMTAGAALALLFLVTLVPSLVGPSTLAAVMQDVVTAGWALLPIAAGIAILKYRLYEIDVVISRSLVYGALTVFVLGVYAGLVAVADALSSRGGAATSLLAAVVVAVAFAPVKDRVQRTVDRLVYGERQDPYRAVSQLGARLEAAMTPQDVLPAIVAAVAQSLRVPYAAVELLEEDGLHVAARIGAPKAGEERLSLSYRGEPVGTLVLGLRPGEGEFSPADHRLLDGLARQVGVAVHAVALTRALQRSRERIVTAREEERRRLRRDLHDGLGPALAAVTLQLEAAIGLVDRDPHAADQLLDRLRGQTEHVNADIQRLVDELRPPALDELGLLGALREQANRLDGGLRITIDARGPLPELPAAVEVAAYRIGLEALTNVVRHAAASACMVRLEANGLLELEVTDDGRGLASDRRAGVGLGSMRERAAELGGTCTIEAAPAGGTRVRAQLPLEAP